MIEAFGPVAAASRIFEAHVASEARRQKSLRVAAYFVQFAVLIVIFGGWQLAVASGLVKPVFFGAPVEILKELWANTANGLFFKESVPTLAAVIVAFVLAAIVGIAAGILLHEVPFLHAVFSPFIAAFNGMPRIALAPITIVWFGLGMASKVALAFSLVVFIELITTEAALRNVDPDLLRLCRSLGASKMRTLVSVQLPWAMPNIFAGLRLGFLYAVLSVIVTEMISAPDGLGQLISLYSNTFQISKMFAALVFLSTFTILADAALQKIEKRLKVW